MKNQETELSLKCKTGTGAMAIWEVDPGPFLDTNGFPKFTENYTCFT